MRYVCGSMCGVCGGFGQWMRAGVCGVGICVAGYVV